MEKKTNKRQTKKTSKRNTKTRNYVVTHYLLHYVRLIQVKPIIDKCVYTVIATKWMQEHKTPFFIAAEPAMVAISEMKNIENIIKSKLTKSGEESVNTHIIVIDVGGGTSDVSVVEANGTKVGEEIDYQLKVVGIAGIHDLGGQDINNEISKIVIHQIKDSLSKEKVKILFGEQIQTTTCTISRKVEEIKIKLSRTESISTTLSFGHGKDSRVKITFTRSQLYKISIPFFTKILQLINDKLSGFREVSSHVYLAGGTVHIHGCYDFFQRAFPDQIVRRCEDIRGSVAAGGTHWAAMRLGWTPSIGLKLTSPHDIRMELSDNRTKTLMPGNINLPAIKSYDTITNASRTQKVTFSLFEGNSRQANSNKLLGRVTLDLGKVYDVGTCKIIAFIEMDDNGLLVFKGYNAKNPSEKAIFKKQHHTNWRPAPENAMEDYNGEHKIEFKDTIATFDRLVNIYDECKSTVHNNNDRKYRRYSHSGQSIRDIDKEIQRLTIELSELVGIQDDHKRAIIFDIFINKHKTITKRSRRIVLKKVIKSVYTLAKKGEQESFVTEFLEYENGLNNGHYTVDEMEGKVYDSLSLYLSSNKTRYHFGSHPLYLTLHDLAKNHRKCAQIYEYNELMNDMKIILPGKVHKYHDHSIHLESGVSSKKLQQMKQEFIDEKQRCYKKIVIRIPKKKIKNEHNRTSFRTSSTMNRNRTSSTMKRNSKKRKLNEIQYKSNDEDEEKDSEQSEFDDDATVDEDISINNKPLKKRRLSRISNISNIDQK